MKSIPRVAPRVVSTETSEVKNSEVTAGHQGLLNTGKRAGIRRRKRGRGREGEGGGRGVASEAPPSLGNC